VFLGEPGRWRGRPGWRRRTRGLWRVCWCRGRRLGVGSILGRRRHTDRKTQDAEETAPHSSTSSEKARPNTTAARGRIVRSSTGPENVGQRFAVFGFGGSTTGWV